MNKRRLNAGTAEAVSQLTRMRRCVKIYYASREYYAGVAELADAQDLKSWT